MVEQMAELKELLESSERDMIEVLNRYRLGELNVVGYCSECDFINTTLLGVIRELVEGSNGSE